MENTCSGQKGPPSSLVNLSERLYEKKNLTSSAARANSTDTCLDW